MNAELGCNDLEKIYDMISELRSDLIFGFDSAGIEGLAEMHFLAALASLESASISMKLAQIHQMRAMV